MHLHTCLGPPSHLAAVVIPFVKAQSYLKGAATEGFSKAANLISHICLPKSLAVIALNGVALISQEFQIGQCSAVDNKSKACTGCRWRLQDQCMGCGHLEGGANRASQALWQAPGAHCGVQWARRHQHPLHSLPPHGLRRRPCHLGNVSSSCVCLSLCLLHATRLHKLSPAVLALLKSADISLACTSVVAAVKLGEACVATS